MLTLHAKLNSIKANKAMMFSASGFQKGAVEYASENNIALITFRDGRALYETRNQGPPVEPPPWVNLPRFAAHRLYITEEGHLSAWLVQEGDVRAIDEFLAEP